MESKTTKLVTLTYTEEEFKEARRLLQNMYEQKDREDTTTVEDLKGSLAGWTFKYFETMLV